MDIRRWPRLIYDNRWRKGIAIVSTPVADPQHPVSDTQIDTKSMYWKSSDETITPTYIPMNLGAGAGAINFVAILGHNIEAGTTITFEHDDNAGFGTPTSIPITNYVTNIFQFFTAFTEQWVRLKLVKAGGWTTAPQIATIFCGSYVEFNRRPIKGYVLGKEDITDIEESDSRVIFAQEKDPLNEYKYSFEALDNTTETAILAFLEECRKNRGFVWCTNYSLANRKSIFVRNTEMIYPVFQYPGVWKWGISMREIV